MDEDLQLGVTTLFRDATKQNLMSALKTPQDWQQFHNIKAEAKKLERAEKEAFDLNKDNLVAEALEKIINEAGSKTLEHPTPFGTDKFSTSANAAEALRRVERAHQGRLTKIRDDEGFAYAALNQGIRIREQSQGVATRDFNLVNDRRRAGPDR